MSNLRTFTVGKKVSTYIHDPRSNDDFEYLPSSYWWSGTEGTLPPGLKLEAAGAGGGRQKIKITGTPKTAGTYEILIRTMQRDVTTGWIGPWMIWEVKMVVTAPSQPKPADPPPATTSPSPPDPAPPTFPTTTVPWSEAKLRARQGDRIQLESWSDRWVEFDGALWWITAINAITKVVLDRRIVQTTDSSTEWFSQRWRVVKGDEV